MGSLPKERNDFDVQRFLELAKSMIGTTKLIILDSNNREDLPQDWKLRNMKELVENPVSQVSTTSSVASSVASSVGSSVGAEFDHQMGDTDWNDEVKLETYKFHVHQCQAQIEIWRSSDLPLTLTRPLPNLD